MDVIARTFAACFPEVAMAISKTIAIRAIVLMGPSFELQRNGRRSNRAVEAKARSPRRASLLLLEEALLAMTTVASQTAISY
jgi:hypothetical protein